MEYSMCVIKKRHSAAYTTCYSCFFTTSAYFNVFRRVEGSMAVVFLPGESCFPFRRGRFFLGLSFLAGMLLGIVPFFCSAAFSFPWMRGCLTGAVSIVGVTLLNYLPFLLSAYAVSLSRPGLLAGVALARGWLFSFTCLRISLGFGTAGWIVRLLLLFSDLICLPLLYFFWLRLLSGGERPDAWELLFYFSVVLLTGSVDICLISPILASIISI